MNFHDVEMLSAYLDGELSPTDASRLESRLAADEGLRRVLDDLRGARGVLRQLPRRRAPRNFTLRPTMTKLAAPVPRAFPALRFATVLASLLFLASIAVNGLVPLAAQRLAAAPAPALGKGGGIGGGPAEPATSPAEAPSTEAPLQSFAGAIPTPSAEAAATAAASDLAASAAQAAPPQAELPAPTGGPVPVVWELVLATAAIVLGCLAWYLGYLSKRNFRSRWIKK